MKKKTYILTLLILFLVSTTGFPVFSHYCLVRGESVNSECNDCVDDSLKASTCCVEEIDAVKEKIEAGKTDCCVDKFDYKKIEDDFFQSIIANQFSINCEITKERLTSLYSQRENKFSEQTKYNLPPPKFGKKLLYTIHQLKIDLPVC